MQKGRVPRIVGQWARLVVGLTVSVTVGLAPFLGRLHVPLFTPMLSMIPESLQAIAIPFSAASMGIVAVLVQWYGSHVIQKDWLHKWFRRLTLVCVISLVLLAAIEMLMVVRVDVPAANDTVSFAVGLGSTKSPPCVDLSRADCIKHKLSLDEAQIDSYFGEGQANVTKFFLVLTYIVFMSSLGALVGSLMLGRR